MNDEIKIGDFVNIYWENITKEEYCKVLYIPCDTGDSWRLQRINGDIFYIMNFCKMELLRREKE